MTIASASLFDQPSHPPAESAGEWIVGLLSGTLATSLCIIAVAVLGMMMLTGRLPLRQGLQVVLGCFVLLGAATIAVELRQLGKAPQAGDVIEPDADLAKRRPLPPANYNPYEGASLRRK